jgi:hypothetical protein
VRGDWVRHVLWWQVYPLGATGAERAAPAHTFALVSTAG